MRQRGLEARLASGSDPKFRALTRELHQEYVRWFGDAALQYQQYGGPEDIRAACLILAEGRAAALGQDGGGDAGIAGPVAGLYPRGPVCSMGFVMFGREV